jgi:hypothetical protein
MWYKNDDDSLNMNEPIVAYKQYLKSGLMLLPSNVSRKTYDWFDMSKGTYATNHRYQKPEDAVKGISKENYKVCNVKFKISKS